MFTHLLFLSGLSALSFEQWFGILELPFLFVCIVYSFKTAQQLKGGVFGTGMMYLAWGFIVMAVGHISMQITSIFGLDIFDVLLDQPLGKIAWFTALMTTWGLSSYGFYKIYKASKN